MEKVINTHNNADFAESTFNSLLTRYFQCECSEDKNGNLVCIVQAQNLRQPSRPRVEKIHIHREFVSNYGYVRACIEKCVRGLLRAQ